MHNVDIESFVQDSTWLCVQVFISFKSIFIFRINLQISLKKGHIYVDIDVYVSIYI